MEMHADKTRPDTYTAMRVDLILILLPAISREQAAQSLADVGVPADVAARVLDAPERRRPIAEPTFPE